MWWAWLGAAGNACREAAAAASTAVESAGRQQGIVTEWNGRGFGFIQFLDGRRAYVHHSAIGGGNLEQGEHVSAKVIEDSQNPGKWAATDVQRVMPMPQLFPQMVAQPTAVGVVPVPVPVQPMRLEQAGAPRQDGVVASWSERGYGFIVFADGRRAYVHHTSIHGSGSGQVDLKEGEMVNAIVVEDAQNPGKWAALDVHRRATMSMASVAQGSGLVAAQQIKPVQVTAPVVAAGAAGVAVGERMEGIVMDWNSRGFGFILFPDGRRAYVHHSSIGGGNLQEGETVTATLVEDSKNPGKWAAVDVRRGVSSAGPLAAIQQQMPQQGQQGQQGQAAPSTQLPVLDPRAAERLEGVVTEWNERGYGFLQVSDGRRAYVHVSAFGGGNLVPGEIVNVIIVEDPQSPGKWQARALQRGPLGEDGIVVEWRREGGYGFVAMEDGRRVYIHHSVFGGGDLYVGLRLRVQTKPDGRNPGKWSVSAVKTDLQSEAGLTEEIPSLHRPCGATVLEWDLRGYGFVQTDDGRRVYVHHSAFGSGNLAVGERVSVLVIPDQRNPGKLMAQTLARDGGLVAQGCQAAPAPDLAAPFSFAPSLDGAGGSAPAPQDGNIGLFQTNQLTTEEWLIGSVTEWHEERGYGFIELLDGRRLYVHHTAFGGGSLVQGSQCEATVAPDKVNHGKWQATAVRGDAVIHRPAGTKRGGDDGADEASKRQRGS